MTNKTLLFAIIGAIFVLMTVSCKDDITSLSRDQNSAKFTVLANANEVDSINSYNYVNVSGDNAYVLDTIIYKDGSIIISRTVTQDSATLRATIVADTLVTVSDKSAAQKRFNKWQAQINSIQTLKTQDSLIINAKTSRLTQQRAAIDSIVAN